MLLFAWPVSCLPFVVSLCRCVVGHMHFLHMPQIPDTSCVQLVVVVVVSPRGIMDWLTCALCSSCGAIGRVLVCIKYAYNYVYKVSEREEERNAERVLLQLSERISIIPLSSFYFFSCPSLSLSCLAYYALEKSVMCTVLQCHLTYALTSTRPTPPPGSPWLWLSFGNGQCAWGIRWVIVV